MKAAKILRPHSLQILDLPEPEPAADELVIQVMASGICGTDLHIFRGEYLGDYPVIPGHEFSGIVTRVGGLSVPDGPAIHGRGFKKGDRVAVEPNIACDTCYNCLNNRQNFCLNWQAVGVSRPGGMAQYVSVPEKAAFNIGDLAFEQGAFVEPLSCVLHGLERTAIHLADRVAVLGAGPIGCLILQVVRLQGCSEITVVEKNKARLELAASCGADICLGSLDELRRDYYDVVIDATGVIAVLERSLEFVRFGGKLLWFGVPPSGKKMTLEPFTIFRKGLTLLSSFTSVRNSYQALDLLKSGRVSTNELVSHQLTLEQFQAGMEMIEQGRDNVRKVLIRPNG